LALSEDTEDAFEKRRGFLFSFGYKLSGHEPHRRVVMNGERVKELPHDHHWFAYEAHRLGRMVLAPLTGDGRSPIASTGRMTFSPRLPINSKN
jgi:hypothetical protein